MSVKVMNAVFDRYPVGGGEMLLALALADHAHDDGSHVFPSVETLALKSRQCARTVQYQLRKMESGGWLVPTGPGHGGRGKTREYRISSEWLAGVPFDALPQSEKSANDDVKRVQTATEKGCNPKPKRVQSEAEKGATAVAPAIEPQEPSLNTSPIPPSGAEGPGKDLTAKVLQRTLDGVTAKAEGPKPSVCLKTFLAECKTLGVRAIPPDDPVYAYAASVQLPEEMLHLQWFVFKRARLSSGKRQKDWRQTFRNSVEANWFRLWLLNGQGVYVLSTQGQQAQRLMDAEAEEGGHAP